MKLVIVLCTLMALCHGWSVTSPSSFNDAIDVVKLRVKRDASTDAADYQDTNDDDEYKDTTASAASDADSSSTDASSDSSTGSSDSSDDASSASAGSDATEAPAAAAAAAAPTEAATVNKAVQLNNADQIQAAVAVAPK